MVIIQAVRAGLQEAERVVNGSGSEAEKGVCRHFGFALDTGLTRAVVIQPKHVWK